MARLKAAKRNKMSASEFALPGKRMFPLNDAGHDRAAIQMAPRSLHAGNISKAQELMVVEKARAKLKSK